MTISFLPVSCLFIANDVPMLRTYIPSFPAVDLCPVRRVPPLQFQTSGAPYICQSIKVLTRNSLNQPGLVGLCGQRSPSLDDSPISVVAMLVQVHDCIGALVADDVGSG
jgi:hypothetical protein